MKEEVEYHFNEKDQTITIVRSPFGDEGVVYNGYLGLINHFILQLKSYRALPKTTEEREYLEMDIAGYEELLAKGSEEIVNSFINIKQRARASGKPFKNNLEIIDGMKMMKLWD